MEDLGDFFGVEEVGGFLVPHHSEPVLDLCERHLSRQIGPANHVYSRLQRAETVSITEACGPGRIECGQVCRVVGH